MTGQRKSRYTSFGCSKQIISRHIAWSLQSRVSLVHLQLPRKVVAHVQGAVGVAGNWGLLGLSSTAPASLSRRSHNMPHKYVTAVSPTQGFPFGTCCRYILPSGHTGNNGVHRNSCQIDGPLFRWATHKKTCCSIRKFTWKPTPQEMQDPKSFSCNSFCPF